MTFDIKYCDGTIWHEIVDFSNLSVRIVHLKMLWYSCYHQFDQTVDLIVNLQKFNPKRENVNVVVSLPYKIKDKKRLNSLME